MSRHAFQSIAIVPAAGLSARMGCPKLLLPWGKATVIEAVVAAWLMGGVDRVVAIVRSNDEPLAERCRAAGALVVQPDVPPPDMKASVGFALQYAMTAFHPSDDDVWLLAPADMPHLSPFVIRRLLANHDPRQPAVLVPTWNHKRGHPILVPWLWRSQVDDLGEDEGINALVARLPVREFPTDDPSIRIDLDTPDDYRRVRPADTSAGPDQSLH